MNLASKAAGEDNSGEEISFFWLLDSTTASETAAVETIASRRARFVRKRLVGGAASFSVDSMKKARVEKERKERPGVYRAEGNGAFPELNADFNGVFRRRVGRLSLYDSR